MALRRVFIYLGAVFLMSHIIFCANAGAVDLVIDLNQYEKINTSLDGTYYNYGFSNTADNQTNVQAAVWNPNTYLRRAETNKTFSLKKGDVYTYTLDITSTNDLQANYVLSKLPINPGYAHTIIGIKQVNNNNRIVLNSIDTTGGAISDWVVYNTSYEITVQLQYDVTSTLGSHNQNTNDFYLSGSNLGGVTVSVSGFQIYRYAGSQENKEQAEATQDSVDQSQQEGSSSQSDAQTGTASLISTIGSAVSAITSASPTNCLINGNMGNFDMGQIDLCANPVPTFVQIISSLILILITVPLCIVMFNRFIGLFRSFQG